MKCYVTRFKKPHLGHDCTNVTKGSPLPSEARLEVKYDVLVVVCNKDLAGR